MNAWKPETNPMTLRRVGKTSEEAAELLKVLGRITIQGYAGVDPESGRSNEHMLTDEIADVYAQLDMMIEAFGLDADKIESRRAVKCDQMREWEALFS